jgi:hypothetical protein
VLEELEFQNFRLSQAEVGLDFVGSRFSNCSFEELKTEGHFWGSRDVWNSCNFRKCRLVEMISPMNTFSECHFDEIDLQGYRPYQTVFRRCVFSQSTFTGLRAQTVSNSRMRNADLKGISGQLLFQQCQFRNTLFQSCSFDAIVFERCSFEAGGSDSCNFKGIVSDFVWWCDEEGDPFKEFLNEALNLLRAQCGADSAACREFEQYTVEFVTGRTDSRDFSACLYNNRVPYSETRKIINGLRKLVGKYGL